MTFRDIFKLDVGRLAVIMFAPLLFIPLIGIAGIFSFYTFMGLWIYFLAIELFPLLPKGHRLKLNRFKFYYFATVLSIFFTFYILFYTNLAFERFEQVLVPLNFVTIFFLLNCFFFISKEIICIKTNKPEILPHEYIGIFVSFWLLPFVIGVLFIQPTIKSIFEKASLTESEEIEETEEISEEVQINFTPHYYKSDFGELKIEQEYHKPNIGEKVYLNGVSAPNGKYKIGFLQYVYVADGLISSGEHKPETPLNSMIPLDKETEEETPPKLERKIYNSTFGEVIIEQEYHYPNIGEKAYLNGQLAPTGKYDIGLLSPIIIVDGVVSKKIPSDYKILKEQKTFGPTKIHLYKCKQGDLNIEQEYNMPNCGEHAYLNGKPAPTGTYKIGLLRSLDIEDGIVIKT
jgi:hypothetical protein